jgi:hypothetical protein
MAGFGRIRHVLAHHRVAGKVSLNTYLVKLSKAGVKESVKVRQLPGRFLMFPSSVI